MSAVRLGSNAKANRQTPLSASKRRSSMFLCREPFSLSRRGRPSCDPTRRRATDRGRWRTRSRRPTTPESFIAIQAREHQHCARMARSRSSMSDLQRRSMARGGPRGRCHRDPRIGRQDGAGRVNIARGDAAGRAADAGARSAERSSTPPRGHARCTPRADEPTADAAAAPLRRNAVRLSGCD